MGKDIRHFGDSDERLGEDGPLVGHGDSLVQHTEGVAAAAGEQVAERLQVAHRVHRESQGRCQAVALAWGAGDHHIAGPAGGEARRPHGRRLHNGVDGALCQGAGVGPRVPVQLHWRQIPEHERRVWRQPGGGAEAHVSGADTGQDWVAGVVVKGGGEAVGRRQFDGVTVLERGWREGFGQHAHEEARASFQEPLRHSWRWRAQVATQEQKSAWV